MASAVRPDLTHLDWMAVSVALADAARLGDSEGGLFRQAARAVGRMLGATPPTPLANGRLEAVRRFVVETRRRRKPATEHVPALAEHGFSDEQIEALGLLSI